jgi:hypothetical protein
LYFNQAWKGAANPGLIENGEDSSSTPSSPLFSDGVIGDPE